MKKRLVAAGIKVASYAILFRDCRDDDEKIAKMHDLLRKFGLKGKPCHNLCLWSYPVLSVALLVKVY